MATGNMQEYFVKLEHAVFDIFEGTEPRLKVAPTALATQIFA